MLCGIQACIELIKGNFLDDHLRPIFTKRIHAMSNARLAVSSNKKDEYDMRIKPEIWSSLGEPTELHVMALTLTKPESLGRCSSPLLLLTRYPVPQIAPFLCSLAEIVLHSLAASLSGEFLRSARMSLQD